MILVLGSQGQLGAHFKFLRPGFSYLSRKDFELSKNWDKYEELIKDIQPEVVINCTAYTKVDLAEKEEEEAFLLNSQNIENLARFAKKYKHKLVHFSTDYVFDGALKKAYTENNKTNPKTIYGKTKREGEKAVLALGNKGLVIRTSWLFGPSSSNFVQAIVRKLKTGETLSVVNDQTGSPTYTKDLALAALALVKHKKHGLFHFANSGETTWHNFAIKVRAYLGYSNPIIPIKTRDLNLPASRPEYSVLQCRKYMEATNQSIRSWDKALGDYLKEVAIL